MRLLINSDRLRSAIDCVFTFCMYMSDTVLTSALSVAKVSANHRHWISTLGYTAGSDRTSVSTAVKLLLPPASCAPTYANIPGKNPSRSVSIKSQGQGYTRHSCLKKFVLQWKNNTLFRTIMVFAQTYIFTDCYCSVQVLWQVICISCCSRQSRATHPRDQG